jgi:hypothetical protein
MAAAIAKRGVYLYTELLEILVAVLSLRKVLFQ